MTDGPFRLDDREGDRSHDRPAEWACPVCAFPILHTFRPGRPRLYCSQACRQAAYRWRVRHQAVTRATPTRHAERARGPRLHALRTTRDPMSRRRDHRRREVTVCGALARPSRRERVTHTRFLPGAPRSCATCSAIVTTGLPDDAGPHYPDPADATIDSATWFLRLQEWIRDPESDWRSMWAVRRHPPRPAPS